MFAFVSICISAIFFVPQEAHAHPHVFIDVVQTVHLDERGIAGVSQEWRLQGSFSLDIEANYDTNHDGAFDEAEQASIYDTKFLPLWLYNNLFRLKLAGVEYTALAVKDFSATMDRGEVRFFFYIPCGIDLSGTSAAVDLIAYDSSIYVSFDLNNCLVEGRDGWGCSLEFISDPGIISHGPDRCGTWVRLGLEHTGPVESGTAMMAGAGFSGNLVPMTGSGPAAPVNPFTGAP